MLHAWLLVYDKRCNGSHVHMVTFINIKLKEDIEDLLVFLFVVRSSL